jgi:hypothetical protein
MLKNSICQNAKKHKIFISLAVFGAIVLTYISSIDVSSFEVVIARYKEDLSWVEKEFPQDNVIVYNKGPDDLQYLPSHYKVVKLPNIGREIHTYLWHILHNYDSSTQRTLFLQGNPYDHHPLKPLSKYKKLYHITRCKNIIAVCLPVSLDRESEKLHNTEWEKTSWADTVIRKNGLKDFTINVVGIKNYQIDHLMMTYGAQFAVDKQKIHKRSKEYYEELLKHFDIKSPIEGHYMERLWDVVFQ